MFKSKTVRFLFAYAFLVLQVGSQSSQTSTALTTLTTVPRNVTELTNGSTPNTTTTNTTSSAPVTEFNAESTSRMVVLIVVSLFVVGATVAIWIMWRKSRRLRAPRANGQVPRPPDETEDLSTVLQNPGFVPGSRENEQLSGLSVRLAEDDADDLTAVYHELDASPRPDEQLMDEFYPIEIPEDDRG